MSLTAAPATARAGTTVTFTIRASDTHAPGALTYQLDYGDGQTAQNTDPTVCQAGPGPPVEQTWEVSHAYERPGTFHPVVTVAANCTPDRARATVSVTASAA